MGGIITKIFSKIRLDNTTIINTINTTSTEEHYIIRKLECNFFCGSRPDGKTLAYMGLTTNTTSTKEHYIIRKLKCNILSGINSRPNGKRHAWGY